MIKVGKLPANEAIKLYAKACELREQGLGRRRIAKALNISPGTVDRWLHRHGSPYWRLEKRAFYKPNLSPSPELAYVIGVCYGDGTVYRGCDKAYHIKLEATDKEFVEHFSYCLSKIVGREPYPIYTVKPRDNRKLRYGISARSKALYHYLMKRELHTNAIEKYSAYFLRGFFDSEGSVWLYYGHPRVDVTNSDIHILKLCKHLMEKLGIKSYISRGKRAYRIRIYSAESVKKVATVVGFTINRKQKRIEGERENARKYA